MLPVPHFQVVFTLDHLINEVAYVNPKAVYDLLFATANQVLKDFAQRYLGGKGRNAPCPCRQLSLFTASCVMSCPLATIASAILARMRATGCVASGTAALGRKR